MAQDEPVYDLVLKGGTIVTAASRYVADVAIRGDRIAAIGRDLHGQRHHDLT